MNSTANSTASITISQSKSPLPVLGIRDAIALIVGIVAGTGIFRTSSVVAANAGSESALLIAWLIGGVISMAGAMCYAELASAYPNPGGELHFLRRAFGSNLAFLFAWARLTVIPTGSVALIAFVFGDYASQLFGFSTHSSSIYAALVVIALTALNVFGIRQGKKAQNFLTATLVCGVLMVIIAGLMIAEPQNGNSDATYIRAGSGLDATWGLMMVFVLLTYGGWNDAAYISAEIRGSRRNIARALISSMAIIVTLYLLINAAFIRALGLQGMAQSDAVASDLMRLTAGNHGAQIISMLIALSALTSANATILMGARSNYALGKEYTLFSILGRWNYRSGAPTNALLVQGSISLLLVLLGSITRKRFETMVEYTAPVFWFFFLLTGISLFVLRAREPEAPRPFRVPFYPATPIIFCTTSAYLLYSSLAYTGAGAIVSTAVLAAGALLLFYIRRKQRIIGQAHIY